MTTEEKFIQYFKSDNYHIYQDAFKTASDLALIAEEGREVIAEGYLQEPDYEGTFEVYDGTNRKSIDRYLYGHKPELMGKEIRITLEVIE